jgi:hypothetical protein
MDEVLLNGSLEGDLRLLLGVSRESLLALGSLGLDSVTRNETRGVNVLVETRLRKNEVIPNVHQASNPFKEVGRRCPSHDQPSIISSLCLVAAVIQ